jgi:tetratricopeptide (TPR) repeat protein
MARLVLAISRHQASHDPLGQEENVQGPRPRMKIVASLLSATLALAPLAAPLTATAQDAVPTFNQAMALLKDGKKAEALQAFEAIVASHPPEPSPALYEAAAIALDSNKWQEAKPYAQQLVKLNPGSMLAWELMVQVDQASGATEDEKLATDSLYSAWRSALDPSVKARLSFTRDRIFGPKRTLIVNQTLEPIGEDILRYVFQPIDSVGHPSHYLILHSDSQTNEQWRDAGTITDSQAVYHLDEIKRQPDGTEAAVPYKFFIGEPDYETVRKVVVDILNGQAKPQIGDPDPYWTTDDTP